MRLRIVMTLLTGIALISWNPGLSAAASDAQFKLKPGARGNLCLKCHSNFQDKMKQKFLHTPLKNKECSGCHNPHTSAYGKMMAADSKSVCSQCHAAMTSAKAKSTHKVVADGQCMKCHDPHSAANKDNLLKEGRLLCFSCHSKLGENIAKVKYKHRPVESNCLTCHLAHSSDNGLFLLKKDVTQLCLDCHRADKPMFIKKHMNYPVAKTLCTSCHNPHGSDNPGILLKNVHSPVAKRMCNQCHEEPTSQNPLKTKKEGMGLCRGCHNDMFNRTFDKNRMHWPLVNKQACLGCHNPHASEEKALLREQMGTLCGKCHTDTMKRQTKNVSKHEPVAEGRCTDCHDPHSSNYLFLAKKPYDFELCAGCHDWAQHSTHPIGEKIRDPRNKNLALGCSSCHRSHGTEFKKMLYFKSTTEQCIQCHEQMKR